MKLAVGRNFSEKNHFVNKHSILISYEKGKKGVTFNQIRYVELFLHNEAKASLKLYLNSHIF